MDSDRDNSNLDLKTRSLSTYNENYVNVLNTPLSPKFKLRKSDIPISPLSLKALKLQELKKNKKLISKLDTVYISSYEKDENSDFELRIKRRFRYFSFDKPINVNGNKAKHSINKHLSQLNFQVPNCLICFKVRNSTTQNETKINKNISYKYGFTNCNNCKSINPGLFKKEKTYKLEAADCI